MSTHADHEAYLRIALHAAADSLEPREDGLDRIRARLQQPRPAHARLRVAYGDIVMRTPAWLQDAAYRVADWFRLASQRFTPAGEWLRLAYQRFAPAQAGRHRSRAHGLLRPLAAMAVVMFIVAAGTYVAIDASTAIFPSSSSNAPSGGGPAGGHSGAPAPRASHTSGTRSPLGTGKSSPAPAQSCKSSAPAGSSATPAAADSTSQGASSPTPGASTSTDTSSPSPDSSTSAPAASAPPSPAPSANPPTSSPTTPLANPSGC